FCIGLRGDRPAFAADFPVEPADLRPSQQHPASPAFGEQSSEHSWRTAVILPARRHCELPDPRKLLITTNDVINVKRYARSGETSQSQTFQSASMCSCRVESPGLAWKEELHVSEVSCSGFHDRRSHVVRYP